MKKVISVSLGSPERDWQVDTELGGEPFQIARRGVGLDYARYEAMIASLATDPEVAAIGFGGINRYLVADGIKYPIRRAEQMVALAGGKPVVDGVRLKLTMEPAQVGSLAEQGILDSSQKALMVCAVDRWGMAQALAKVCREVQFGDLAFALDIPIFLRSLPQVASLGKAVLPLVTQKVPFEWLYPTGESKNKPRYHRRFAWADVVACDFQFIGKSMPDETGEMKGKVVLTNTVTAADRERLKRAGVKRLITTTPNFSGRSFGTNVIEGVIVALVGKPPEEMTDAEYLGTLKVLGWDQPADEEM
jgi:hypothetical protein